MRKSSTLAVASMAGLLLANTALAQPRPYNDNQRPPGQFQQGPRGQGPGPQSGGQYYYNGRWVDGTEWQRHGSERDRWARGYQRRRGGQDDSSSVIAGIIGFALGAAIVGSAQQADRARTADESWQASCAKRYRSYDRASRTYMGLDGARHYCQ